METDTVQIFNKKMKHELFQIFFKEKYFQQFPSNTRRIVSSKQDFTNEKRSKQQTPFCKR